MTRGSPRAWILARIASRLDRARMGASAVLLLLSTPVFALMWLAQPPRPEQQLAADPLLSWLQPLGGAPVVAALAAIAGIAWWRAARPDRRAWREATGYAIAGAAAGMLVPLLLHAYAGDTLPAFIPPEESAAPGMTLGIAAGLLEEVLFRFGTLPLVFLALHRRIGVLPAAALACVATGLLFALSHEAGQAFVAAHFATRVLIPGIAMCLAAIVIHPAFVVTAHLAAHVAIPLLFVSAG